MTSFFRQRMEASPAVSHGHTLLLGWFDVAAQKHAANCRIDAGARDWSLRTLRDRNEFAGPWAKVLTSEIERDGPPLPVRLAEDPVWRGGDNGPDAVWEDFNLRQQGRNLFLAFTEPNAGGRCDFEMDQQLPVWNVACGLPGTPLARTMDYHVCPRLALRGTVNGVPVTGTAWFDHQWGGYDWLAMKNENDRRSIMGWDWFGMNLDDGSDWVLMRHWRAENREVVGAHATMCNGGRGTLASGDLEMTPLRFWRSENSRVEHPVAWRVRVPKFQAEFVFEPLWDDQEVPLFGPARVLWEGAGRVTGTVAGRPVSGFARGEFYGWGFLLDVRETLRTLADRVDKRIAEFLPRRLNQERIGYFTGTDGRRHDTGLATDGLSRPVWDLLDRKGKRWRPVFGMLLLEALGKSSLPYEDILCLIAELMHTGSLIIDDIEDRSLVRRNAECIHVRYGESVAINAANTLYFLPLLRLFEHPRMSGIERSQACEIIIRRTIRAHFGQGLDIQWSSQLSRENLEAWMADGLETKILDMYAMKTGAPVEAVAEVACVIAHVDDSIRAACVEFARGFAVAFQIMDDVRNFDNAPGLGKTRGEDLAEGKLTYVIVDALRRLRGNDRTRLMDILCSGQLRGARALFQEGCALVRGSGALEACGEEAARLANTSWEQLTAVLPNSWPRLILAATAFGVLRSNPEPTEALRKPATSRRPERGISSAG